MGTASPKSQVLKGVIGLCRCGQHTECPLQDPDSCVWALCMSHRVPGESTQMSAELLGQALLPSPPQGPLSTPAKEKNALLGDAWPTLHQRQPNTSCQLLADFEAGQRGVQAWLCLAFFGCCLRAMWSLLCCLGPTESMPFHVGVGPVSTAYTVYTLGGQHTKAPKFPVTPTILCHPSHWCRWGI